MKKVFNFTLLFSMFLVIAGSFCIKSNAAAETATESTTDTNNVTGSINEFMSIVQASEGKESPDAAAQAVAQLEAGTLILVVDAPVDGWYEILYQNTTMYVQQANVQSTIPSEELLQEMQATEAENAMIIEAVERARADARRARIWGIIIVLLIVGIFAVGIISTIQNNKAGKESGTDKNNKIFGKKVNKLTWVDVDKEDTVIK